MNLTEFAEKILSVAEDRWNVIDCVLNGGPSYRGRLSVSSRGDQIAGLEVITHRHVASLKDDLSIGMAWGLDCRRNADNSFHEDWIDRLGVKATGHFLDFFYNGNLVYREIYVSLYDGKETCLLPVPHQDNDATGAVVRRYTVPDERRRFYQVLNTFHEYDQAFKRWFSAAGFEIVRTRWIGT